MGRTIILQILIFVICLNGLPVCGQTDTIRGVSIRIKNEQTGTFESIPLYQKSYALVIGESKYKFTSAWKELEGVRKDVPAITKLLKEQGFDEVVVVQDLTRAQLDQTIRGFISKYGLARENRLLIYYAGHGYTETTEDGLKLGYIVPVDAPSPVRQPDVFYETAMSMNDIESYALSIRSKHVLFVFDSCFSGTILRKTRSTVPPIITLKAAQPVRQFITSGAEDQEVPDVSEFRQQFEKGLRGEADLNNDGYVTGSELGDFLQEKVTNYSRGSQTPLTGKIANGALDKGDFIFILKKSTAVQSVQNLTNNNRPSINNSATSTQGTIINSAKVAWKNFLPIAQNLLKYDTVLSESEGLAGVESNDMWGFIDKTGKVVVPIKYYQIYSYSEGLGGVRLDNKWGFVDKNGNLVLPIEFRDVNPFREGLTRALIKNDEGKNLYGYIDKLGRVVIEPKYYGANHFYEGLAPVRLRQTHGYIDKSGNEVIAFKYEEAYPFIDGLAPVKLNGKWGFINKLGNKVISYKYDNFGFFREGLANVVWKGKHGYISKTGEEIISFKYDYSQSFSEGLASVQIGDYNAGKWGFIDKTGKEVIPIKYDTVGVFSEGLVAAKLNGKWGIIDKKGKEVISIKFDKIWCWAFRKEGFIGVVLNGKKGFVDIYGNEYFDF